ncbi:MUP4 protein, partial [Ramphastos sulfuratus]|nr:MUP4 protein [Ramphastos sulfuratus]
LSVLLQSQLEQLLGPMAGAEQLQLQSLLVTGERWLLAGLSPSVPSPTQLTASLCAHVADVNECSAGVSLCGEGAECFNGLGTYLCRCRQGYEDHSPTKAGTSCVPAPRSGTVFLQHADILVGAAIAAALATLVAAGAMCRAGRWRRRRLPSPEEAPGRAAEEPRLELRDLGQCLRLDPFQLKLRARTPEWLWGARTPSAQAYQLYLEQSTPL